MLPAGFVAIADALWKPFLKTRSTPKVTPFKWRRFTVPTKRELASRSCQLFSLSGAREPPRCPGRLFLSRSLHRGACAFQPHRVNHLRVSNTMATFVPALIRHAKQRLNWQTLTPAQRSFLMDATIIGFLFLLALILRLPYLHDVPRYPWDELRESGVALSIARGEAFPLTNFDSYIGALYNYLLAGAFFVFGEHPGVPHLVVAFICSATAPILYLFGKEIDGRATGLIAATLFSCNAQQIFNGSHWGYSNSLTPVFSILALWLIWRAIKRKRPWSLFGGAFAFGLALQTHPTAVVFVPPIIITFFLQGRQWLWGRWPFLAIGCVALGYANVIAYNIATRGGGLVAGLAQREHYAFGRSLTLEMYSSHFLRGIAMFMSLFEGSGIWGDTPVPSWLRTLFFGVLLVSLS